VASTMGEEVVCQGKESKGGWDEGRKRGMNDIKSRSNREGSEGRNIFHRTTTGD